MPTPERRPVAQHSLAFHRTDRTTQHRSPLAVQLHVCPASPHSLHGTNGRVRIADASLVLSRLALTPSALKPSSSRAALTGCHSVSGHPASVHDSCSHSPAQPSRHAASAKRLGTWTGGEEEEDEAVLARADVPVQEAASSSSDSVSDSVPAGMTTSAGQAFMLQVARAYFGSGV